MFSRISIQNLNSGASGQAPAMTEEQACWFCNVEPETLRLYAGLLKLPPVGRELVTVQGRAKFQRNVLCYELADMRTLAAFIRHIKDGAYYESIADTYRGWKIEP